MTEAGNKHGYTGIEHKKERLVEEGDGADEGEKEIEGRDDIFKRVKQVNLHTLMVSSEGIISVGIRRKR